MSTPRRSAAASLEVDAPLGDGPSASFPHQPHSEASTYEQAEGPTPSTPRQNPDGLWFAGAVLWRHRWLIVGVTFLAAIGGLVLSLAMPKWYSAETRVMLPDAGGSSMSALIETVAPGASSLLGGGGGGDYTRYLAILTSRTVMERLVDRFDLIDRYETRDEPDPMAEAILELSKNTTFEVSLEYNYLAIHVLDRDPRVSAAIANTFVQDLNRENTRLSSESAREQRVFVETRLREAEAALDSVMGDIQRLQERYGITAPEAQGEAVLSALGDATTSIAEADVRYQALRSEFGDENPQTVAARVAVETARAQMGQLTSGNSEMMPVPIRRLPQIGRQYGQMQQEMMIQAKILEFVRPMYEQALFDERRTTSAVQVIDEAVPPARKAKPKRAYIVLGVTASVFVLLSLALVARALYREKSAVVLSRLKSYEV